MDEMYVTDGEAQAPLAAQVGRVVAPRPAAISREELVAAVAEAIRRGELRLELDGGAVRVL